MAGSKGPSGVRHRMIIDEQMSFNFNLQSKNYFEACLKLQGIAGLFPEKYKIPIPELPRECYKPIIEQPEKIKILEWIAQTQTEVYKGLGKFIEESYKEGDLDF